MSVKDGSEQKGRLHESGAVVFSCKLLIHSALHFLERTGNMKSPSQSSATRTFAPAADRNKDVILNQLKELLQPGDQVLELGSGTGQHACYFSNNLPGIHWQPTELAHLLPVIEQRLKAEKPPGVKAPLELDLSSDVWPPLHADLVYTCNTLHIISEQTVANLFDRVGTLLEPGGKFCAYGPFKIDGKHTADSNRQFDEMLHKDNPLQGVRDMAWLNQLALGAGLDVAQLIPMPKNNFIAIWIGLAD